MINIQADAWSHWAQSPTEFSRFRMANQLSIVYDANQYSEETVCGTNARIDQILDEISQMHRIPPLEISDSSGVDVLRIFANNQNIAEKVQYLTVEDVDRDSMDYYAFGVLSSFQNVQYLHINVDSDCLVTSNDDPLLQTLQSAFRNLKGLKIGPNDRIIGQSLLQSVSDKLSFLSWNSDTFTNADTLDS